MFKKRLISTVLLWGLVLGSLFFGGGAGGVAVLAVLSGLAQWEFYALLERLGYHPQRLLGLFAGTALILIPYFSGPRYFKGEWELLFCFILMVIAASYALTFFTLDLKRKRILYSPTSLGVIYIPCMLHFLVYIFKGPDGVSPTREGMALVLWVVAVAKFTDVGGLLVGSFFGKHRLAPKISPKKTWEGVWGGLALAVLVGAVLAAVFPGAFPRGFTVGLSLKLAVCLGVIAILSDLAESALKRQANVKDSGAFLPGIGGILDLVDSLIFTAPMAYFLLNTLLF